ncbi:glycosyltransferase [Pseudohoeflea coraliihabitans]|uniref:Glycosyltransferase family 2 protein n=1 Tax=Pseudohoeflea coraliihabitans TaxID=2860393 RepID=A0ABS6WKU9_9HYPH|nr:glycosyltransferase family 2 protein [Pseudohoeflea sp. DP4N28-3]MBW3096410.1 glycosyltransferase family 2 protein [Pseudohoeflea sp. DP4N28-3]
MTMALVATDHLRLRPDPLARLGDEVAAAGSVAELHQMHTSCDQAAWQAAVAIPARNEANHILACLSAVGNSIRKARRPIGVVLVVNNSTDLTAARAIDWLGRSGLPYRLVEVTMKPDQKGAGPPRRLALDLALGQTRQDAALFSTDADSVVDCDWIREGLREIAWRADVVCGAIGPPDNGAGLPAGLAEKCAPELAYRPLTLEVSRLLDRREHDPRPAHDFVGGANLIFRRQAYEAVGGLPPLACSEDRAFVRAAERHDCKVVFSAAPRVATSQRLFGRARGGMADTLRERIHNCDPICDQDLEPAETAIRRLWARGRLRRSANASVASTVLPALGIDPQAVGRLDREPFGAFWHRVETLSPRLQRTRLTMRTVARELFVLQRLEMRLRSAGARLVTADMLEDMILTCRTGASR